MADTLERFIYFLRARRLQMLTEGPTADEARVLAEHANYLKRLAEEGVVMLAGRTSNRDETTVGIVIVNAADEAAARAVMESDPFVKNAVMNATLFPFNVAFQAR
ncbi:MAG TPA: YciI family protein [Candidatus Binataceae bacterium]|nr:YciI family protein [Candidatus Binataceae bacterium]